MYLHSGVMKKVFGMIELSQKRGIEDPQVRKRWIKAFEEFKEAPPSRSPIDVEAEKSTPQEEEWPQPQPPLIY